MSDMDLDAQQTATTPPSAASPSSTGKRRRTAANSLECCRTCRLRKVKCGGNPGNARCTNCARLDLTCSFFPDDEKSDSTSRTTPSASHTEAGTLRKRAQRACNQCHAHKTKCSGDLPRCRRCETSGLPCEYSATKRKFTSVRFPNGSPDEATSPSAMPTPREESSHSPPRQLRTGYELLLVELATLNDEEMIMRRNFLLRHMDLFMEFFYYVPCLGYLNPDIWYKDINDMTISAAKAAAMCSLTCFFNHPGEEGRNFGVQLANVVDMYVLSIINDFSEETFMLLSINTLFYLLHGSFAKVWNCFGMLSRLMIGMQVNWEGHSSNSDSFMQEETIRRMVWQVFSMDRLLAGGYEEYIACRVENMTIRLPCIESAYRQNTRVLTDRLSDVPQANLPVLGLHGWQIRATDLRHRIQVTTRKLVMPSDGVVVEASSFMSHINQLQNELSKLHLNFPKDLKLDAASMRHYMSAPERAGYVWLHSHVGVAHIDLYRFALPGFEESISDKINHLPPEFVRQSQRQAVAHALSVARFINGVYDACKTQPSSTTVRLYGDYSMTHMGTQALRVLLVALQYDLFHDLAAYTTAPPWANAKADKDELHRLIEGILKATEGWAQIFRVTKQAYDCNKDMVDDFYRTNTFVERRIRSANDARPLGYSNGTLSPSTGSDQAKSDGSPGERWLSVPQSGSSNQPGSMGTFDAAYGPPGIPTFLENARTEGGLGASPGFSSG